MLRLFEKLSAALCHISGVLLIIISFAMLLDIILRNMGKPSGGIVEVVEVLFTIMCFFAFSWTHLQRREIRLDAIRYFLSGRPRFVVGSISAVATILLFSLLSYFSYMRAMEAWANNIFRDGTLLLPMWIPWSAMFVGSVTTILATIVTLFSPENLTHES